MFRRFAALALASASFAAFAQLPPAEDPDWKEKDVPPPPALRTSGLIPIEMPQGVTLRYGVDPDSISVGKDGVVRYVVVASSASGAVNAMYEGVRCSSGEVKVYARHNPDSGWVANGKQEWMQLSASGSTRHSLLIARTGACFGDAPNRNEAQIVRDLRSGVDRRFLNY